jgi:hypothetical protein
MHKMQQMSWVQRVAAIAVDRESTVVAVVMFPSPLLLNIQFLFKVQCLHIRPKGAGPANGL